MAVCLRHERIYPERNSRTVSKDEFLNPILSGNGKIGLDSNLTEKSVDYSLSGYFASEENNF